MELKTMRDLHKAVLPAIHYDWFCQTYKCKMLRSVCERRQELAKGNGTNAYRAQYSFTCGQCKQVETKKGVKMITEEEVFTIGPTEAENQEFSTTRVCRNCKELLPMEDFTKNNECVDGREWTCRKCRAERKKLTKASRKTAAKMSTAKVRIDPSVGLQKWPYAPQSRIDTLEPPRLPVGLPPGVTVKPVSGSNDSSITIDFSDYPDLLISISETAKREFRTPMMQILYMLSKFSDKAGD